MAAASEVENYLEQHQQKELLRLVVVGSVDDGKSTLIGRLLHDTNGVYDDQLSAVKQASTQAGMEIDFSLFTDGLKAEREQGITIDVAYRYCSTPKRKFIIADTPGHVQYTRNMATGASTANVGLILIDARLGVQQQSRRHAYIASLLGIPHLCVAINKMDLVDYDQKIFDEIAAEFKGFAKQLSFRDVTFVPVSALKGDNVVEASASTPWYGGRSILGYLETVPISQDRNLEQFRYPVQYVLRPHLNYRGYAGEIVSGTVKQGDTVMVLPSRKQTRVRSIDTFEGPLAEASTPLSVTITLEDEVDISRGDMLVHPESVPQVGTRVTASVVWMSEKPLDVRKSYLLKHTAQMVRVEVDQVLSRRNLDTLAQEQTATLELNDIGRLSLRTHRPLYFDSYIKNRGTGAFILVDSLTNATLAAGMIDAADTAESTRGAVLGKRSQVSPSERTERLGQQGGVLLLEGLPGSGKTRLAYAVERLIYDRGGVATVIDRGDRFSSDTARRPTESRVEAARRLAELGVLVVLPCTCLTAADRDALRAELSLADRVTTVGVVAEEAERRRAAPDFYESHTLSYEPVEAALSVSPAEKGYEEAAKQVIKRLVPHFI